MYASVKAAPRATDSHIPIETMRGLAVVLLVGYHVVGSGPAGGLRVGYPHELRLFADFFIDLRMPFFAFIAGYVYALRPPSLAGYVGFMTGKFRRLYLPAMVAALAFFTVAYMLDNRMAKPVTEMWRPIVMPYMHFWFLQAILLVFAGFALLDACLDRRHTGLLLLASCAVYLTGVKVGTQVFSAESALYLLPYFLLGVVFKRNFRLLSAASERFTFPLVALVVACALWNIKMLYETGTFSLDRRDTQSLVFGLVICSLAFFWCPRLPVLERLSPFAFTIYLYHVFGTVAARMVSKAVGIEQLEALFMAGVAGGLFLPIALHLAVRPVPGLGRIMLGTKPDLNRRRLASPLRRPLLRPGASQRGELSCTKTKRDRRPCPPPGGGRSAQVH